MQERFSLIIFFTSTDLLIELREKGFQAIGTIQENRTGGAPLRAVGEMKKEPRGSMDFVSCENAVTLVHWNDNSVVTIGINIVHDPWQKMVAVKQRSSKEKKNVDVNQPVAIAANNTHMGGVDLHDQFVSLYRINIGGKKWWWPIFMYVLDTAVKNAWLIYHQKSKCSLLEYRWSLVCYFLSTRSVQKRSAPMMRVDTNVQKSTVSA